MGNENNEDEYLAVKQKCYLRIIFLRLVVNQDDCWYDDRKDTGSMDREEMIKELMENEGLSKDEAEERLVQYEEEEEQLGY